MKEDESKDAESVSMQEVIELRQKVTKLEKDFQGACSYARRCELKMEEEQKQVKLLEDIIDKKPAPVDNADKKLVEELQEKIEVLTSQLAENEGECEAEKLQLFEQLMRANEESKLNNARIDDFTCKLAESERELSLLRNELRQANKDQISDDARFVDLTSKFDKCEGESAQMLKDLKQANEDREKNHTRIDDLVGKLAVISAKIDEALRKEVYSTKMISEKDQEITTLKLEIEGMKKLAENVNQSNEKIGRDLNYSLSSLREQAYNEHQEDQARIAELMSQMAKCEEESSQLKEELKQANEDKMSNRAGIDELMCQMSKCKEDLRLANEGRMSDLAKFEKVTGKLAESDLELSLLRNEKKQAHEDQINDGLRIDDLMGKLAVISAKMDEALRKEVHSTKMISEKDQEITTLKLEIEGMKKLAETVDLSNDNMGRDLNQSLNSLREQLDTERMRAYNQHQEDRARIDELMVKLSKCEDESSHLKDELKQANEDKMSNHTRIDELMCQMSFLRPLKPVMSLTEAAHSTNTEPKEQIEDPDKTIQSEINEDQQDEVMHDFMENDGEMDETVANEKIDERGDLFSLEKDPSEKAGEKNVDKSIDIPKSSTEKIEIETRKRPSRSISNRKNYVESDQDSDEETRTSMKKMYNPSDRNLDADSDSSSYIDDMNDTARVGCKISKITIVRNGNGKTMEPRVSRLNHTALECPECEFRTSSVQKWQRHLVGSHATTPTQAGLIFRCECGNESFSYQHSLTCKISKITIVRKGDGTTKETRVSRMNHMELECPECDFRTMSVGSWAEHLHRSHSTNPTRAGLILRCECGNESMSFKHSRACEISKITVIRKEDGTSKKAQRYRMKS